MRGLYAYLLFWLAGAAVFVNGCDRAGNDNQTAEISVTNTYLQAVVWDVCGNDQEIPCLTPPGMCPGHFDISPRKVDQLRRTRLLLRFDFQQGLETQLQRLVTGGLKIVSIETRQGMCLPETYLWLCREVASAMGREYPENAAFYQQRLSKIKDRMDKLTEELRIKIKQAKLKKTRVIASGHQAEFAGWLGLEVVGTFEGSDSTTPAQINECLRMAGEKSVKYIIATQQEGTGPAQSLTKRLNAKMVVFSNFPDATRVEKGFDGLVLKNIERLCGL